MRKVDTKKQDIHETNMRCYGLATAHAFQEVRNGRNRIVVDRILAREGEGEGWVVVVVVVRLLLVQRSHVHVKHQTALERVALGQHRPLCSNPIILLWVMG